MPQKKKSRELAPDKPRAKTVTNKKQILTELPPKDQRAKALTPPDPFATSSSDTAANSTSSTPEPTGAATGQTDVPVAVESSKAPELQGTTPEFPLKVLRFADLRLDMQMRVEVNEDVIKDYAEKLRDGIKLPAPLVFYDGNTYTLVDGYHTKAAYEANGITEAACEVRPGSRRDALLYACGANAEHGLRRTNADKRHAVETVLKDDEWQKWTNERIARACGVSGPFVAKMRDELGIDVTVREQEDGRKLDVSRIGSATGTTTSNGLKLATEQPEQGEGREENDTDAFSDRFGSDPVFRTAMLGLFDEHAMGGVPDAFAVPADWLAKWPELTRCENLGALRERVRAEKAIKTTATQDTRTEPERDPVLEEMKRLGLRPIYEAIDRVMDGMAVLTTKLGIVPGAVRDEIVFGSGSPADKAKALNAQHGHYSDIRSIQQRAGFLAFGYGAHYADVLGEIASAAKLLLSSNAILSVEPIMGLEKRLREVEAKARRSPLEDAFEQLSGTTRETVE